MTILDSRRLLALGAALLLAFALPAGAQSPNDSMLVRRIKQDLDSIARDRSAPGYSKRAQLRAAARADSVTRNAVDTVRLVTVRVDTLYATKPVDSSATPTPTPPPPVDTAPPPVIVTPGPPPSGVNFTHPFGPPANGAVLAALPQDTMDASYPAITRRVSCTNLQACLDTAKSGDEVLLAKGASFTDVVVRPTARPSWVTVRTAVTDVELGGPWERMTPAKAATLNLATIRSSGSSTAAITVASGAHHVRFVGVRVTTSAPTTNALVRIGLGEATAAQLPHNIVLDRSVVDPGANDLRRCVVLDGYRLAVLSSTLANCHSRGGDAQGILSINGRGVFRIENNTIQGSHQSIMFGGGDPAIAGQVPSDVVVRRNDLTRPYSWRAAGWPAKTNFELKLGKRILVEGNVIGGSYPDAQIGYAVLLKSENQDGGTSGNWSETADVTVRYNRIVGAAGGFNLAGLPQGPGVPMSRVTVYGNVADSIGVGPYYGEGSGDALQLLGVADVIFRDNWTRNPNARSCIYSVNPNARFVATGLVCGGEYGIRGEGGLAFTMPNSIVSGNTVLPWRTTFGSWPAAPADSTRAALLAGVVVP